MRLGMLLVATALSSAEARANGRFPGANYFVAGPGSRNDVFALRTTFGLLLSRDGGRAWSWVCEGAYGAIAGDPALSIGADGTLVLASYVGLSGSSGGDYCTWAPLGGVPVRDFIDVSQTADGRSMVALAGPGGENALYLSSDGGRTWNPGARLVGYTTETVDVAPSDPTRVYVTGYATTGSGGPVLLRSDDGGRTVREATRDFLGGESVFLAGVDLTRPDVIYLRAVRGLPTTLLRSDDGGMTVRLVAQTAREMLGFALSDDGDTVWIASADPAGGILRSERGGPWTRTAADLGVKCLRFHAGTLFVCADEARDGFALGYSRDGGDHVDPLLSLRLAEGASGACGPGTQVGGACASRWATETMLLRDIDASVPTAAVFHDGSTDHGVALDRASPIDGPTGRLDAGQPTDMMVLPPGGCGCRVAGRGGGPARGVTVSAWLTAAVVLVGRLRRRAPARSAHLPAARLAPAQTARLG